MKAVLRNVPNLVSAAVLCILMLANSVYMPASFSERVLGFARRDGVRLCGLGMGCHLPEVEAERIVAAEVSFG